MQRHSVAGALIGDTVRVLGSAAQEGVLDSVDCSQISAQQIGKRVGAVPGCNCPRFETQNLADLSRVPRSEAQRDRPRIARAIRALQEDRERTGVRSAQI